MEASAPCVREINWLPSRQVDDELRVDVQSPVRLSELGGPDLAVIRARDYGNSLPTPEDVLLLIEVADTSLVSDREVKLPLYTRSGIAEVWLVNLNEGAIERCSGGYRAYVISLSFPTNIPDHGFASLDFSDCQRGYGREELKAFLEE